jgi:hypothetical protein
MGPGALTSSGRTGPDAAGVYRITSGGVQVPQPTHLHGMEAATTGLGGQWDGGLGALRTVAGSGPMTSAPQSMGAALDTGPGKWAAGGLGAQRTGPVQGPAQGQQGVMQLPGPGQWDGATGALRPTANMPYTGTQDTPAFSSDRAAGKFLGAGATTSVPRSKSLFWTDGVGAYASMPSVPAKPTPDRTDSTPDKHVYHLSLLREAMLAAHPTTGPDTRAKPQAGPVRPGAETASVADCITSQRLFTSSAMLNAAVQAQNNLPKGCLDLYDIGYESDV